MTEEQSTDFLLEQRLRAEDPALHRRMRDSVFVLQHMLSAFLTRFPHFTDHSMLHSMDVLNFCNQLLGPEQVRSLSPQECYALIMSCYLHDIGMGISDRDYSEFSPQINFVDFFLTHNREDAAGIVRAFHNEFSGLFIRKYERLFDFPGEELTFAIIQISRGHRKTDLFNETEYPEAPIRTAYLSAILRLADEIDVASERNPELLFDTAGLTEKRDIEAFGTHESIRRVVVRPDRIELVTRPKSPEFVPLIDDLAGKIQQTLGYCRDVAAKRSDLRITQQQVTCLNEHGSDS